MDNRKLELIFNEKMVPIEVSSFPFLTQFGPNFELKMAFKDQSYVPSKIVCTIKTAVTMPLRTLVLEPDAVINQGGTEYHNVYRYQLTHFDTSVYTPTADITIYIYDINGTVATYTRTVQMLKSLKVKMTPINL